MKLARLLPLVALAAAACQQNSSQDANPDGKPGLSVSDGLLVLPAVKGNPGAAYFTLTNAGSSQVELAAAHIEGAGKTEMHQTMGGTMSPVQRVVLRAGQTVKFERGGSHVMVFDLGDGLKPGGTAELTLTFSGGDKLSAPMKIEAAGGGGMSGEMPQGMADMNHEEMDHADMNHERMVGMNHEGMH